MLNGIFQLWSSIDDPQRKTSALAPELRDLFCHLSAWGLFAAVEVGLVTTRERALDKTESEPHNCRQQDEFHQRFTEKIDRWLDAGYGSCILARPDCKTIMESSLRHFDGERYELGEFIVMPNHVHAIVATIGDHQLSPILHSWKSFSAHKFNRILGSSGRIWLPESFDHIVRSAEHLAKFEAYIRNNANYLGSLQQ